MIRIFKVKPDHDNIRVDRWFKINISKIPQSLIQKFLRLGKIKVNKKKVKNSYRLYKNDKVYIYDINIKNDLKKNLFLPSKELVKSKENEIIFNNNDYIVINKSPGVAVQGGTKSFKNLIDIYSKSKFFENSKPYTVHRLDKETSGVMIIAKNRKYAQLFTSLFRIRKIYKTYLAICIGEIKNIKGILVDNLEKKENNKKIYEKAITNYKVLNKNSQFSLVELKPLTGRKHQLRKQTSLIGHPIVGDDKYSTNQKKTKKLMLHASSIKFKINGKNLEYSANLPDHFLKFLKSTNLNYLSI